MTEPYVLVVLVLYKMQLEDSPTYLSWLRACEEHAELQVASTLLVCDNTPGQRHDPPIGFNGRYIYQPENPGLAQSYNLALQQAVQENATWLMLLDQDTVLTSEYLLEILSVAREYNAQTSVVAAVPKLMENGVVQSPHSDLTTKRPQPLPPDFCGFSEHKLHMYNSGALIRVSTLRSIGGFPEEFWLDFLDHATFHLLRKDGGRVLVMKAQLQHQLSTNAPAKPRDKAYLDRHRNVLEAEFLFYKKFGSPRERWWYKRRLIHTGLRAAFRHRLFRIGWRTLRMASRVQIGDAL